MLPWMIRPNGFLTAEIGNVQLMVEKVGAAFRLLVTRSPDNMQPPEVLAAGTTANAHAAMEMAEQVASQHAVQGAPGNERIDLLCRPVAGAVDAVADHAEQVKL